MRRPDLYPTTGEAPPAGSAAPYSVSEHIYLDGRADRDGHYVLDAAGQVVDGPHETAFAAGALATHWNRWAATVTARATDFYRGYFGGSDLDRLYREAEAAIR